MSWPYSSENRARVIAKLAARDGDRCWFCNRKLRADITIEHLIPRSVGGPSEQWNLALAHKKCNNEAAGIRFSDKLVLRDRMRTGWHASAKTLRGNLRTRRRNARYEKQARKSSPFTVSLLALTKVKACGVCGRITAKTIQESGGVDPKCANCATWASSLMLSPGSGG